MDFPLCMRYDLFISGLRSGHTFISNFFFFVSCSSRSDFAVTWFRYSLMVDDTLSRVDIGCFFPLFFLAWGGFLIVIDFFTLIPYVCYCLWAGEIRLGFVHPGQRSLGYRNITN